MVTLNGMTWSHPRGYDPLVASSTLWKQKSGVEVGWDKRSLQDFESFPVEELARRYDLIVIDHPHVGQVTAQGCLLPLDDNDHASDAQALAAASVGHSYESYRWNARQWALPIDAASQVQAWRPDLIAAPARTWADMLGLAAQGRVLCPMRPPHSLMVFYTLAANLGHPCARQGTPDLIEAERGTEIYAMMQELMRRLDPACLEMDPIAVYERMARPGSPIACVPLIYGYVSYAIEGFRGARIGFADIPSAGTEGPVGSTLGGTGIAVSAGTQHSRQAIDFAYWLASGDVQRGPYAAAGGQPGHAAAWEDGAVNDRAGDFYRSTRTTLEGAWVRPRHAGYMGVQDAASARVNAALTAGENGRALVADLNGMFRASLKAPQG